MGSLSRSPLLVEVDAGTVSVTDGDAGGPLVQRETASSTRLPFLKWAGGKQWLAPAASLLAPSGFEGRYFEPFLGGASFFLSLSPRRAVLSDSNADLIATYRAIRCSVDGVIARLSQYQYGKEAYYVARASSPSHALDSAARFIYLNRACWNGLYRVNQRGRFNVPFGRFARPTICDPPRLRCVADALASADVRCDDFEAVVGGAWLGDFVYLDPPYITGHTGNGFHKYNARLFSWIDQDRLARVACKLRDKGVHVLVSNAADARVVHLYKGFYHYRVRRRSLMAGTASARGIVTEALLSSYPLLGCSTEVIE